MDNAGEEERIEQGPPDEGPPQEPGEEPQREETAEKPSTWKHNRAIGTIALIFIIIALAFIIWYAREKPRGTPLHFLCESTGKVFTVYADPDNQEYIDNYMGAEPGVAMPCRFDDKNDAYLARKNADGQWVKQEPEREP